MIKRHWWSFFAADNGVVAEGVTQTGQEVTKIVAENFLKENTTAAIFCRETGADICPIDIGMVPDSSVRNCKVARGTKNMAVEPAMTRDEAIQALEIGIMLACEKKEQGYDILATGEMGIGNTTTSSAIASVLLEKRPEEVTGKRGAETVASERYETEDSRDRDGDPEAPAG